MELIPVPAALMSCFLLAQEPRHKQAGIPHRGRWQKICLPCCLERDFQADFTFNAQNQWTSLAYSPVH